MYYNEHACMPAHSVTLVVTFSGPAKLFCPWDSPGENTGMGCHVLLQGIFPSQGLNLGLLHCRHILYCLSHQGSPITYYMA